MGKKSASQIRRMQKRALERGESYEAPIVQENTTSSVEIMEQSKYDAALKLKKALDEIEKNPNNLNSKEKRSAKRKAEAIALEEASLSAKKIPESEIESDSPLTADELLEWFG